MFRAFVLDCSTLKYGTDKFSQNLSKKLLLYAACGPGSMVSIATGYRLDGPGIESQWGARFSAPVQTGPGAHPAPCTVGTGSFMWVTMAGAWCWPLTPFQCRWSWKSRAIPLLPLRAVQPVWLYKGARYLLLLYSMLHTIPKHRISRSTYFSKECWNFQYI